MDPAFVCPHHHYTHTLFLFPSSPQRVRPQDEYGTPVGATPVTPLRPGEVPARRASHSLKVQPPAFVHAHRAASVSYAAPPRVAPCSPPVSATLPLPPPPPVPDGLPVLQGADALAAYAAATASPAAAAPPAPGDEFADAAAVLSDVVPAPCDPAPPSPLRFGATATLAPGTTSYSTPNLVPMTDAELALARQPPSSSHLQQQQQLQQNPPPVCTGEPTLPALPPKPVAVTAAVAAAGPMHQRSYTALSLSLGAEPSPLARMQQASPHAASPLGSGGSSDAGGLRRSDSVSTPAERKGGARPARPLTTVFQRTRTSSLTPATCGFRIGERASVYLGSGSGSSSPSSSLSSSSSSSPSSGLTRSNSTFSPRPVTVATPGSPLAQSVPVTTATSAAAAAAAASVASGTAAVVAGGAATATATATAVPTVDAITQSEVEAGTCVLDEHGEIKFATLDVLVERITLNDFADPIFMQQFILTYPLHTPPGRLLDIMIERYHSPVLPAVLAAGDADARAARVRSVQLRVIVFLQAWLKRLWNSSTPPELTEKLEAFVEEIAQGPHRNAAEQLRKLITRRVGGEERKREYVFTEQFPQPLLPLCLEQGLPPPPVSVRTLHPKELARQMTLVERDLFGALQPWEFQELRFAKKDKSLAPNVNAITQHFNRMSRWFAEEVLQVADLDERTRTLERCIDVAACCQELQNYNAVNEIISSFNSSAVHRLHKTWKGLSTAHMKKVAELFALMSNKNSFHALRQILHSTHPPLIPFLGVYLTDLTFIEEGNPTMRGDLINWNKCRLQARVLTEIEVYKENPYCLQEVPWIRDFLLHVVVPQTEDDMWNQSITAEPRTPAPGSAAAAAAAAASASSGVAGSPSSSSSSASAPPSPSPTGPGAQEKKLVVVLPPGVPQFLGVRMRPDQTVTDLKEAVLALALKKQLLLPPPTAASTASGKEGSGDGNGGGGDDKSKNKSGTGTLNADDYTLVAPATRQFPIGVSVNNPAVICELDFETKGVKGYAMFRDVQVLELHYTLGPESVSLPATLDAGSPLFATAVLIDVVFLWQEEFYFMYATPSPRNELRWLDPSASLQAQGFDPLCRLIVVPKSLMLRPDPEDRAAARAAAYAKRADCKCGYLTKYKAKHLLRAGIVVRPFGSSSASSSLGGSSWGSSSSSSSLSLTGSGIGSSSGGSSSLSMSGRAAAAFMPRSFMGTSEKDRRWFVVVDGFLFWYADAQAPAPKDVWCLGYCGVSYGTLSNGVLCVVVRPHALYPFPKLRPKSPLVVAAATDAATREWHAALSAWATCGRATRVFGVGLHELAARRGADSLIPAFVRHVCETIHRRPAAAPDLFTAPVAAAAVERLRADIDRGLLPRASGADDDAALAQLLLAFLAEMPEPLLPPALERDLHAYARATPAGAAADAPQLARILARLPPENAATLRYVLHVLCVWEAECARPHAAEALLAPLLLRPSASSARDDSTGAGAGAGAGASASAALVDVAERVARDLCAAADRLGLPTDADARRTYTPAPGAPRGGAVPATVFAPDVRAELLASLDNARSLDDPEIASAGARRAIVSRTRTGGTSGAGDHGAGGSGDAGSAHARAAAGDDAHSSSNKSGDGDGDGDDDDPLSPDDDGGSGSGSGSGRRRSGKFSSTLHLLSSTWKHWKKSARGADSPASPAAPAAPPQPAPAPAPASTLAAAAAAAAAAAVPAAPTAGATAPIPVPVPAPAPAPMPGSSADAVEDDAEFVTGSEFLSDELALAPDAGGAASPGFAMDTAALPPMPMSSLPPMPLAPMFGTNPTIPPPAAQPQQPPPPL